MADNEESLSSRQKQAARNLMDANAALIGIVNDAYAPIYVWNVLEVVERRVQELKALYDGKFFKPSS